MAGRKQMEIHPASIVQMFKKQDQPFSMSTSNPLPDDVKIVQVGFNDGSDLLCIILESEEWEGPETWAEMEHFTPDMWKYYFTINELREKNGLAPIDDKIHTQRLLGGEYIPPTNAE